MLFVDSFATTQSFKILQQILKCLLINSLQLPYIDSGVREMVYLVKEFSITRT